MREVREEMIKKYCNYVDNNKKQIIDDFCKKIKKQEVGDLNLEDYTHYRFWVNESTGSLKNFYNSFLKDTDQKPKDVNFDEFCEQTWHIFDGLNLEGVPEEDVAETMLKFFSGQHAEA